MSQVRPAARPRKAARGSKVDRRREILDAALSCFSERGYAATTLADIRAHASASTGSIYHHFANKAQIAAELYLAGVRATQQEGLRVLRAQKSVEQGVKALVVAYLDWVQANPALARFLLAMRHADFMDAVEPELGRLNREAFEAATAWFRARVPRGQLPDAAPEVVRAVLFGPVAHFTRRMVRGGDVGLDVEHAKLQLAEATYAAVRALSGGRGPYERGGSSGPLGVARKGASVARLRGHPRPSVRSRGSRA